VPAGVKPRQPKKTFSIDPWILGLLLLAAGLLLTQLGNGRLWQDEAETAVLAKNILTYGYPTAFDGVNLLNPGLRFQDGFVWTYHPWLPMYLAAGSFLLLGVDTVAARLPFALLGLLSIWLMYRLTMRFTANRWVARWTTALMALSVPFLLHMRECRYYAPSVFFSLWAIWAYDRFCRNRPGSALELTASAVLLFHTNHGVFLPVVGALLLHFLLQKPSAHQWGRAVIAAAGVALLTLPFMIYLQAWQHHEFLGWLEIKRHLEYYFRQINKFVIPIPFWVIVGLLLRPFLRSSWRALAPQQRQAWVLVSCLLGVGLLFLVFAPWQRHFRYLIYLVPWFLFIQATFLVWIARRRFIVGMILTGIILFTDLLHYSGPSILAAQIPAVRAQLDHPNVKVRSFPIEYLKGLSTPYRGPIDGIVEYLSAHAQPGQTLKTPPSEDHPLLFYTDLVMEPLPNHDAFGNETYPDWIVIRRAWTPEDFFFTKYFETIWNHYDFILIDAPDIPWQNRLDPGYHRFLTDSTEYSVVLFRKPHHWKGSADD